jgi:hypothetical protein
MLEHFKRKKVVQGHASPSNDNLSAVPNIAVSRPAESTKSGKQKAITTYSPLAPDSQSIRLVKITPPKNEEALIACTFSVFDLDICPDFTALSYAWGPRSPTAKILLDDTTFSVRKNLWDALSCILNTPFSTRGVYFWIDTVCINQEDTSKRTHQVNLMESIFSLANDVLVWLGTPSESDKCHTRNALKYLQGWKSTDISAHAGPLSDSKLKESLLVLFNNPYWSRLWIVQEVCLASDVDILYELEMCPWANIVRWFQSSQDFAINTHDQVLRKSVADPLLTSPAFRLVRNSVTGKEQSSQGYPLHLVLVMWPDQECEDPRNRVFGVLGLTDWGGSAPLRADYSKSRPLLLETVLIHVRPFHANVSQNSKYGFAHTIAQMLRVEESLAGKAAIQHFAEADWPSRYQYQV